MTTQQTINPEASSFKDSDAMVFTYGGKICRKIFKSYLETYKKFMQSGLYDELIKKDLIIPHKETENNDEYIIIEPERVFISYPWEWSFSQLKDAALATLKIQLIALKYGFSLKDGNYFNIQFHKNKPVLIDTTSFEEYRNNGWTGYRQFCENFLAPLALMAKVDLDLRKLLPSDINGISLKLASKLLPLSTYFDLGILFHLHLHANMYKKYSDIRNSKQIKTNISREQQEFFVQWLINTIKRLNLKTCKTEWGSYYSSNNYTEKSFENKKEIISEFSKTVNPKTVFDCGANTGVFSRLFTNSLVYSADIDVMAVEQNYLTAKKNKEQNIIPLVFDVMNPSPAVGFFNRERKTLQERINKVDLVLALALVHHLKITSNLPFEMIAEYFSSLGKYLLIEFIPKGDSIVDSMLLNRPDISDYTENDFKNGFLRYYKILKEEHLKDSERILYLMERTV